MRRKDESKKPIIVNYINDFFYEQDKVPAVREIVNGTGIPLSTVHRYLRDMQEKGELFCADCKGRMSFSSAKGDESKWYFTCSNSRGKDSPCTAHYIRVIVLERLVWHYTQRVIELVLRYEAYFRANMEEKMQTESRVSILSTT